MFQKHLIVSFLIFFIASAFFLFWRNESELDPNRGKSWWTLSFAEPENAQSLGFTIENYSDNTQFRYEIVRNKQLLVQDSFALNRGEKKTLSPSIAADPADRTSIVVTAGKDKKEIYR